MAIPEQESEKKQGDKLEHPAQKPAPPRSEGKSAIPAPDNGSHARSAAAHLGHPGKDHTKPAGDLRADVDRKDSRKAFRGEATRGH